jgi:hypothetical protein
VEELFVRRDELTERTHGSLPALWL